MSGAMLTGLEITLTEEQEIDAAVVGFRRQANARRRNLRPRYRNGISFWLANIEGACAELAASLATELPWTGRDYLAEPGSVAPPDIGVATEVRLSLARQPILTYDSRRDHDDRFYVLVSGVAPTFVVHGYILGATARREEWLVRYPERETFRVPVSAFSPIDDGVVR